MSSKGSTDFEQIVRQNGLSRESSGVSRQACVFKLEAQLPQSIRTGFDMTGNRRIAGCKGDLSVDENNC